MRWAEIDLGPVPAMESCVAVGRADYEPALARKECLAYIKAIRRVCGAEPEGAQLRVKMNPHDYGEYYSVVVAFDPDSAAAVEYAHKVDEQGPTTWEEAQMKPPVKHQRGR